MTKKISRTKKNAVAEVAAPTAPQPVAGVVELCEALAADAKSGVLRAVAVTFVPAGQAPSFRVVAAPDDTLSPHLLNSGVALMAAGMAQAFQPQAPAESTQ